MARSAASPGTALGTPTTRSQLDSTSVLASCHIGPTSSRHHFGCVIRDSCVEKAICCLLFAVCSSSRNRACEPKPDVVRLVVGGDLSPHRYPLGGRHMIVPASPSIDALIAAGVALWV